LDENGCQKWQIIKEKANLKRKNFDQISEYYFQLISQCRLRLKDKESKDIDHNQDKDNSTNITEKIEKGSQENEEKEEKEEKEDKETESKAEDLTAAKCKRIVERILLFSNIRNEVLPFESLEKKFASCT